MSVRIYGSSSYQLKRRVNCKVRAALPELRVGNMPVPAIVVLAVGLPGWFSTLKKSALKRKRNCSVIGMFLNNEASSAAVAEPAQPTLSAAWSHP